MSEMDPPTGLLQYLERDNADPAVVALWNSVLPDIQDTSRSSKIAMTELLNAISDRCAGLPTKYEHVPCLPFDKRVDVASRTIKQVLGEMVTTLNQLRDEVMPLVWQGKGRRVR